MNTKENRNDVTQIASDIKWFLFGDESRDIKNDENFSHDLRFDRWGNDTSFIVTNYRGEKYRITVEKEG